MIIVRLSEGQELALTGVTLPTLQLILKPPALTNLQKTIETFGTNWQL